LLVVGRPMLLRIQIVTYLAVLIGMAALIQGILSIRTISNIEHNERAEEARGAAGEAAREVDACNGDDCVLAVFSRLLQAHALEWAGVYRGGSRVLGTGPEVLPVSLGSTEKASSTRGDVVVRPQLMRDPARFRTAQVALVTSIWLTAAAALVGAILLMERAILRPIRRLIETAEGAARLEAGPFLVPGTGPLLGELATTLDRTMRALQEERQRTVGQLKELASVNASLANTRDSLVVSEKLAIVGRLSSGIAHEVGNPLSAILGYLDLARSRIDSKDELVDCLNRIESEIRRIDGIVRQLLSFARPSPIRLGPTSVNAAVEAAVRLASMPAHAKAVEVVSDVPANLPPVLAEEQRLAQVLVNLLFNAADAMQGAGRIEIRARAFEMDGPARRAGDSRPGPRVLVSVADNGPGIPAEHLGRVFDPFFTTKEPGRGTGLGLAICHGILQSFGGEIRAANRETGGAEFSLTLKVVQE
jgi:two-component system, NtrC family, sensor kinase